MSEAFCGAAVSTDEPESVDLSKLSAGGDEGHPLRLRPEEPDEVLRGGQAARLDCR